MPEDKHPPETPPSARETRAILQSTLRETRDFIARRSFWTVLVGGIFVVALAGPFYTLERFGLFDRLIFWGLTGVFASLLMTGLSIASRRVNQRLGLPWYIPTLISAGLGVLPVMGMVYLVNIITSGAGPSGGFWSLLPYVSVPLIAIHLTTNGFYVATNRQDHSRQDAAARLETVQDHALEAAASPLRPLQRPFIVQDLDRAPASDLPPPLLFEKLPAELGHDLISLRAQDHYVEVTTVLGSATVLMRLSDAERDLTALHGLRVHRSWWVNLDHVRALNRTEGGGMELSTIDGQAIPVARGQRATVRQALDARRSAAE